MSMNQTTRKEATLTLQDSTYVARSTPDGALVSSSKTLRHALYRARKKGFHVTLSGSFADSIKQKEYKPYGTEKVEGPSSDES